MDSLEHPVGYPELEPFSHPSLHRPYPKFT
ncbi:hypothetical protein NITGR_290004 [Nitrospina gracilis 3/211]|uniref:Uncharacterized protein n=1 Tax=Nitrospina gracilis (strain 3/211) TaxID=1266370 RepID=M1YYR6_NITG3|nr:hypothetical protein NITGR_290004 [Nitrospina gracilis 3/211]